METFKHALRPCLKILLSHKNLVHAERNIEIVRLTQPGECWIRSNHNQTTWRVLVWCDVFLLTMIVQHIKFPHGVVDIKYPWVSEHGAWRWQQFDVEKNESFVTASRSNFSVIIHIQYPWPGFHDFISLHKCRGWHWHRMCVLMWGFKGPTWTLFTFPLFSSETASFPPQQRFMACGTERCPWIKEFYHMIFSSWDLS